MPRADPKRDGPRHHDGSSRCSSPPPRGEPELRSARLLLELARNTGGEWGAWIRSICQFEAEALAVERVSFWSLDDRASTLRCEAGYVASRRTFEHGATLLASALPEYFEAIRDARTVAVDDVDADSRTRGLHEYASTRGITSMLDIPVWAEGRLRGLLCHEHVGSTRRWTTPEKDFAVGVGQVVASALAARAHTMAEAAASRAAFLDSVSRGILASLDPRAIARCAVRLAVPRLADVAFVWVTHRDDGLECLAYVDADPRRQAVIDEAVRTLGTKQGRGNPNLAARVVREKQSLLLPDVTPALLDLHGIGGIERQVLDELHITSCIGVPLAVAGRTFGALTLHASGRHYDSDDRALAEDVACRLACALENARIYGIAREAVGARDDFLVLLTHELLTPITALNLMTEDLVRRARLAGDGAQAKRCEAIAAQVKRFNGVLDHIIEASSIRAEGVQLTLATCDLAAVVQACVARVSDCAGRAGTPVTLGHVDPIVGRFDRARIERVVLVLLDNAIKFGNGRPIDVTLRRDGAQARLTVRDRGLGIPAERLAGIFSPFERAVPRENFGGLGLGLYVARAVVEAHGGTIAASSDPGDGTSIVVRIPVPPEGPGPRAAGC